MYKLQLIAILFLVFPTLNAQKIKIDDGTVLLDKVPIAKINGNNGWGKDANLIYSSLDGKEILKINEGDFECFLPSHEGFWFYNIEFPTLGKKMTMVITSRYRSEKAMTEWLFVKIKPSLFKNNLPDSTAINAFISTNDASQKVKNDTTSYKEYEALLQKSLAEKSLERNLKEPVVFKSKGEKRVNSENVLMYDIYQGNTLIGTLDKVQISNYGTITSKYNFYKKLTKPFTINGKTYETGIACFVTQGEIYIVTVADKDYHKVPFPIGDSSEQQIAQFLISKGYL
jgi:hypothetical protein